MHDRSKHLAKSVIIEILRQSGGHLSSTTALFKAFWMAHVEYAREQHSLLTDWPIVRLERGPGIGDFNSCLLGTMLMDNEVVMADNGSGGTCYELGPEPFSMDLSIESKAAIAKGVKWIEGKTPDELSEESHRMSWQWRELSENEEMDIFLELIPEGVISTKRNRINLIAAALK